MIIDTLAQAARYHHLHPLFPRAFAWCDVAANCTLADGRYALQGEDLFVIVESGRTMPASDKRFESHRRYVDIQVNLAGSEIMEWMPARDLTPIDDFKSDGDIRFYQQPNHAPTRLLVRPREFTVFWPDDAHKPCCHPAGAEVAYRKLVFKVDRSAVHAPR
ncbi:MAG: YhcH/YjgK/YiaL family protein [Planctomycetes bacterium]|nr:YhcH/YjgK/YiaL family protein [Planctomycetota bacterium]